MVLALIVMLMVMGVILPAVWPGKKTRRMAALDVTDRLLRWRR